MNPIIEAKKKKNLKFGVNNLRRLLSREPLVGKRQYSQYTANIRKFHLKRFAYQRLKILIYINIFLLFLIWMKQRWNLIKLGNSFKNLYLQQKYFFKRMSESYVQNKLSKPITCYENLQTFFFIFHSGFILI